MQRNDKNLTEEKEGRKETQNNTRGTMSNQSSAEDIGPRTRATDKGLGLGKLGGESTGKVSMETSQSKEQEEGKYGDIGARGTNMPIYPGATGSDETRRFRTGDIAPPREFQREPVLNETAGSADTHDMGDVASGKVKVGTANRNELWKDTDLKPVNAPDPRERRQEKRAQ